MFAVHRIKDLYVSKRNELTIKTLALLALATLWLISPEGKLNNLYITALLFVVIDTAISLRFEDYRKRIPAEAFIVAFTIVMYYFWETSLLMTVSVILYLAILEVLTLVRIKSSDLRVMLAVIITLFVIF